MYIYPKCMVVCKRERMKETERERKVFTNKNGTILVFNNMIPYSCHGYHSHSLSTGLCIHFGGGGFKAFHS